MELEWVSKMATEELLHRGIRTFDVPLRQLFEHDAAGRLIVRADADENRAELARLALASSSCDHTKSGVSLSGSLKLSNKGASLLYATGARLLLAVEFPHHSPHSPQATAPRALGFILYMALRPQVLERVVSQAFPQPPAKALYLELVCGAPHSGVASLLLLRLTGRLSKGVTGLLAHAVNARSGALLERHGYARPTKRNDVFFLSRADALRAVEGYERELLRHGATIRRFCTRAGASQRTLQKRYWDCR